MDLKKVNDLLYEVQNKISRLEARFGNLVTYDDLEFDYDNVEEKFEAKIIGEVLKKLDAVNRQLKYLDKEVTINGYLVKNSDGRWEIEGSYHYYTSGSPIEFFYTEENEWCISRVEYHEDYYIVGYKDLNMYGLQVRVRS